MKQIVLFILVISSLNVFSQQEDKKQLAVMEQAKSLIYEGNELATNQDYVNAEMEYRKAISKEPNLAVGNYNLANTYYEKGNFDEALYRLQQAAKAAVTKEEKHKAYHNIGNVLMQNKKCKEAVEAYKNALRSNPSDEETRYNFALAKQCAEEQQQQEDQNKDQNDQNKENKDQDQDDKKEDKKENEDENKDDQKDKGDQDKKEGEDEKDDKGDPKDEKEKDGNQENKEQEKQKPQPKPGQLSPQQIKNLLEAMNNQEEKVQEKINAEKTKGAKVRSEKDW